MFRGVRGSLKGYLQTGSLKFPFNPTFRGTLHQSGLPRAEKVFGAFKTEPRLNCAFQAHHWRFLETRPAFMLGGLPCSARNHREEQQELWL